MCYNAIMETTNTIKKIYPAIGPFPHSKSIVTSFDESTPWRDANVAFNWLNFEFPISHKHLDWEILIILQDEIRHHINKQTDILSPGTACLIGPKDKHSFTYKCKKKNNFQGVSILIRDSYLQAFANMFSPTLYEKLCSHKEPLYFTISKNSLEKYMNILLEIQALNNNNAEYCKQQCVTVFNYLFLKLTEQILNPTTISLELKSFLRVLNNPSISSEEIKIAQQTLPYSYSQLTRIFKKYMGCTITHYINSVKMNYAKELLSNTDLSLTQITEELNFESSSHFHYLFKQHFGITPLGFRKNSLPPTLSN